MPAEYIDGGSIGTLFPLAMQGVVALDASIALMLPDIMAKIAGALELQMKLSLQPPSLAASVQLASQITAGLSIALTGPSIAVNFSAIAALVAELSLILGQLQGYLALALSLKLTFGHAGLHLYTVEGQVASMGNDLQQLLQSGLPGGLPDDEGFGVFLVAAADPGSIAIIKALIGDI